MLDTATSKVVVLANYYKGFLMKGTRGTRRAPPLTLESAMSVHVLRAHGFLFSELTRNFGANPARFHEILCGDLFPESWNKACERLSAGEIWDQEVAKLVDKFGIDSVVESVFRADPRKKDFQRKLKKARKFAPIVPLARSRR